MMFYVANPGDKMGRIANDYYGNELGRLMLPRLIASNAHTLAFYIGMVGEDILLPPYHIVYLPEFDITHQFFHWKSMAAQLNAATIEVRKNIGMLCESDIDPRVAIAVNESGGAHKESEQKIWEKRETQMKNMNNYIDNMDKIHGFTETLKTQAEKFDYEDSTKNMEAALAAYRANRNIFTKRHMQESYKILQNRFQIEVYKKLPLTIRHIQKSILNLGSKRIFILHNQIEVQKLLKLGKDLKFVVTRLGQHVPLIDGIIESATVYEAYKAGDDWPKAAAEEIAETVITAALTAVLVLTPLGWGALLVGFAADYYGEKIGDDVVDYMWSHPQVSYTFLHHEYANKFFQ